MADTTLDIGVRGGREAKAVVDAVTIALRLLGAQNAANARQASQAAEAARTQAAAMKGIAAAAQVSAAGQQTVLDKLKQKAEQTAAAGTRSVAEAKSTAAEAVANAHRELEAREEILQSLRAKAALQKTVSAQARAEAIEEARTYAKQAQAMAAGFLKVAEARLKVAQAGTTTGTGKAKVTTVDRDLVAAREQELTIKQVDFARAVALGESRIRLAKQVGKAEKDEANESVAAQAKKVAAAAREEVQAAKTGRTEVKAAQEAANAQNRAATVAVAAQNKITTARAQQARQATQQANAAQRAAAQQANAAQRANAALAAQAKTTQALSQAQTALRNTVLRLVAAYSGFRAIEGFVAAGLKFNQIIETSKLGIGALITATATLTDEQGRQLSGTNALAAAQVLATDQLNKLRIAGIQTSATTEELVTAFQEAVGAGLSVGLTLDQIRKFTVEVAQAATTIGLPFNQLNQEVRSILQSTIDRNSRIAKALQLTNAEVNLAKEQGRLADLLNSKFQAFNVAGVESVKTFAALRSNIQDAFQLLAGQATQPLFDSLKEAGLAALSAVFDFKTASIQKSFQGLVDGAKEVFAQIGSVLADAIATAVEKAQDLSKFLERHKQQVKETAAAVSTMVRTFGEMISAIVSGVTGLVTFGHETNTIIGLAHTLDAVFAAIRDNIKIIITLLAARTLITTIASIVAVIGELRAATTGAAIGTALGGPGFGTAIGGIIGLLLGGSVALRLFNRDQREVALETARTTTALQDQHRAVGSLAQQYIAVQKAAQAKGLTDEDRIVLEERLSKIMSDFAEQGGPGQVYLDLIKDHTLAIGAGTAVIRERIQAIQDLQRQQAAGAFFEAQTAQQNLDALIKQRDETKKVADQAKTFNTAEGPVTIGDPTAKARLRDLTIAVDAARARLKLTTEQAKELNKSLQATFDVLHPTKITPKTPAAGVGGGGEAPEIKAARADLERTRAELDVERARINNLFARRVIDAETQIKRLLQIDLAEVDAEGKFLEAQQKEAERKRDRTIKGEKPEASRRRVQAAQDEVNGILIQEQTLQFKRQQLQIEADGKLEALAQEHAEKETEIRARALRAQGRELEASLLEIDLKTKQALAKAEHDFKEFSPEIRAQLKLAITHESFDATLTAIKAEIQRALDVRTNEVQGIKDRFAQSGTLSTKEKQQEATEIAAANQRAIESTDVLRQKLLDIKLAAVGDPTIQTQAQLMLDQLAALSVKAQEVDQEMERLKDGIRNAFEGGFATFFEDLGDRTKGLADAVRDMVSSILKDLRHLVAELLSQRIFQAIVGALAGGFNPAKPGLAGADAAGNIIVPGLAAGGPAPRPAYGRLRGGIPGIDSIPVLAQEDEWFLRPAVRRKYGDAFLHMLNDLRLPVLPVLSRQEIVHTHTRRFAQGGPVMPDATPTTARPTQAQSLSIVVGFDRRGLLTVLEGPVGKQAVKQHVRASQRELGHLLIKREAR